METQPLPELSQVVKTQITEIVDTAYEQGIDRIKHEISCGCLSWQSMAKNETNFWDIPLAPSGSVYKFIDSHGKA